ncbi:ROK family protein [Novosphingobium sp. SG720]|uniref:ROK family protein n=1 Tax=Novosphingobium TaxID=165696 RepID=UPI001447E3D3|nr:ROK family protein [Novosphingobium sp. SG720]NKJ41883.1 fructokinase [Novosphingobium sp. SG720]
MPAAPQIGAPVAGAPLIGAIEAGGTKFIAALATPEGEILARTRIPTQTPETCFPALADFFAQAQEEHGPVAAFGVASFGPIDIDPASPAYGTFTTTPKPGWQGARFHDVLGQFGAPIVVDTDVNGACLGEWMKGAGQGCRTLAYTTIGTGVGTGVVSNGRSLMGISHFESGHILPPRDRTADPFAGSCPYHGDCLEGLASGPAIEKRWGKSLDQLAGDSAAVDLIGGYIAHLAATLVLLHMPDRLIFGGGVMKAPGLVESVRRQTEAKLNGYVSHPRLDAGLATYIVTPGLGDDAGITGAIALGCQALDVALPG